MAVIGFGPLITMQGTMATLCDRIMLKASAASPPSSDVCAVDEDLLDIRRWQWVSEIRDKRPSPVPPLSPLSSVLRRSPAVPTTSSASSTNGGHTLLMRSHPCGPDEYIVAGRLRCFPRERDAQGDNRGERVLVSCAVDALWWVR